VKVTSLEPNERQKNIHGLPKESTQPCLGVNTLKLFYGPLTKLTFDYGDEMPSRNDGVQRKTK